VSRIASQLGLEGRIGLALGSGAARGWAHVGVLRELESAGLRPQIVVGSSAGAIVGAFWAAGKLDKLEVWGRALDRRSVVGLLDLSLRGGLIGAHRLFEQFERHLAGVRVEDLPRSFAAVATDLDSGREVWLREGSLLEAVRASVAVPGLVSPVKHDGRWLVDGGLVNAVPISVCRALGAQSVIAVDLNTDVVGRRLRDREEEVAAGPVTAPAVASASRHHQEDVEAVARGLGFAGRMDGWRSAIAEVIAELRERVVSGERVEPDDRPSIYEVVVCSINVMQARITRSRMAGDPPELLIAPRLPHFALLDFDRASEAIEEGRRAASRTLATATRLT